MRLMVSIDISEVSFSIPFSPAREQQGSSGNPGACTQAFSSFPDINAFSSAPNNH
jgi:hypothetical protein